MKAITGGWNNISILDGSTSSLLRTSAKLNVNDNLVLYNEADGLRKGQVTNITEYFDMISLYSLNDSFYYDKLVVDSSNNIFITGRVPEDNNIHITKYSSQGELLKQIIFGSNNQTEELGGISLGSDGSIFVCGKSGNSLLIGKFTNDLSESDYKLITISDESLQSCMLNDICVAQSGNVYACGYIYDTSYWKQFVIKLDSNLNILKEAVITTSYSKSTCLTHIVVDENENIYCGGWYSREYDSRPLLIKLNSDLNVSYRRELYYGLRDIIIHNNNIIAIGGYIFTLDRDYLSVTNAKLCSGITVSSISSDSSGNLVLSGYFEDCCGKQRIFVGKFDENLECDVGYQFYVVGGSVYGGNVEIDSDNNVIYTLKKNICKINHNWLLPDYIKTETETFSIEKKVVEFEDVNLTYVSPSCSATQQSWSSSEQSWPVATNSYSVNIDRGDVYDIDISSFSLTETPTDAWSYYNPAMWVSDIYNQEEGENDWFQYQTIITEIPRILPVLDGTTNTMLKTINVIPDEDIMLYSSNSLHSGTAGDVQNVVKHQSKYYSYGAFHRDKNIRDVKSEDNATFVLSDDGGGDYTRVYLTKREDNQVIYAYTDNTTTHWYGLNMAIDNYSVFVFGKIPYPSYSIFKFSKSSLSKQAGKTLSNGGLNKLVVNSSGDVVGVGAADSDCLILKFDQSLNLTKQAKTHFSYNSRLYDIIVLDNADILVCGSIDGNAYVLQLDNNIEVVKHSYTYSYEANNIAFNHIFKKENGNYVVAGNNFLAELDNDLKIVKVRKLSCTIRDIDYDNGYIYIVTSNAAYCFNESFEFVRGYEFSASVSMHIDKISISNSKVHIFGIYDISVTTSDCMFEIEFEKPFVMKAGKYYTCYDFVVEEVVNIDVENISFSRSGVVTTLEDPGITVSNCNGFDDTGSYDIPITMSFGNVFICDVDITSFNLTNPPEKVWKTPTNIYVALETNEDRCLYEDEDISDRLQNATTSYFEFDDTREDLLLTGDKLIVNGNEVIISNATKNGETYEVTVPEQSSIITSVIIPARTENQILQDRQFSIDTSNIISTYAPVVKEGRSLRIKVEGNDGTKVSKLHTNLWTTE